MNSIHITGCAFDVIPMDGKVCIWNAKDARTKKLIASMTACGFEAGANWKSNPDSPHFQAPGLTGKTITPKNTTPQLTAVIQAKVGTKADGDWGPKTTAAINAWRKSKGWKQSGKIGLEALGEILR